MHQSKGGTVHPRAKILFFQVILMLFIHLGYFGVAASFIQFPAIPFLCCFEQIT